MPTAKLCPGEAAMSDVDATWQTLTRRVADQCARHGFDLVHPFNLSWQNDQSGDPAWRLPAPGSTTTALGLLVANTGALWAPFLAALRADPELAQAAHPLDEYTVRVVTGVATELGHRALARFGHTLDPSPIPIQRIAQAAGLACLSPSHLSVHTHHGPWLALRAVILVDVEGPPGPGPRLRDPCATCDQPCREPLARALRGSKSVVDPVAHDWQAWLSIRDACPWGKASRYTPEQIEYHYTKRRSLLGL